MNNMLKLSIRGDIILDDVVMQVSVGVMWDVQLCVERENIVAIHNIFTVFTSQGFLFFSCVS